MASMQLSAVMNLGGTFYAQMQKNAEIAQNMKQQVSNVTNSVSTMGSNMKQQANEIASKWDQMGKKIQDTKNKISNSAPIQSLTNGIAVAKDAFGAAGLASAGFLKGCIDGAAKGQKTNMDLAQTIKSTGGAAGLTAEQVSKMASEFSKTTVFGAGAIKTGQNMLLTFTNIGKDVFPQATQAMLDLAQKMGTDPVASSVQLGKALNDPVKGVTALTRVGVTFTEQQKQQIAAMQEAGNIAGAQKIVLAELNKEYGGQAAAAAQTYQGRLQKINNTIGSIKGGIGSALLPYVQKAAEFFLTLAQKIQSVPKPVMDMIAKVLAATAVFGTLIGGLGLLQKIIPMIVPQFSMLTTLFTKLTGPIGIAIALFGAFAFAYQKNLGGFKTFVDGIITKVTPIFTSLGNAIKDLINLGSISSGSLNGLGKAFGKNTTTIATTLQAVRDSVVIFVSVLQGNFTKANGMISQWSSGGSASLINFITTVRNLATGLRSIFFAALGLITGDFKNFGSTLQNGFGLSEGTTNKIVNVFQTVRTIAVDALTIIKNIVGNVFGFLVEHSNGVINALKLIGVGFAAFKVYQGVLKGIQIAMSAWAAITKVVSIAQMALNFVMSMNPFTLVILGVVAFIAALVLLWNKCTPFRTFFINLWTSIKTGVMGAVKGLETGIGNAWNSIKTGVVIAFNAIKAISIAVWNGIKAAIMAVVTPIVHGVLAVWNSMKGGIVTIFSGIKNVISGVWGVIKNIILGPVLLIVDIVKGNWSKLGSDAKVIFTNLGNAFKLIWTGIKQIFVGYLTAIVGAYKTILSGLGNIIKTIFSGIKIYLTSVWNAIKVYAINTWNNLKTGIINIALNIWQGVVDVFNAVVDFFKNLPSTLYELGVKIFTSLKDGAWSIMCGIGAWVSEKFNAVVDFFKNLPDKMLEFGKNFIQGFIDGVEKMFDAVINKVKNVGESIEKKIREVLGIHSPSRVMHGIGQFVVQGLANGIDGSKNLVNSAATKLGKGLPSQFYGWGQDIPGSLAQGINSGLGDTVDSVTDMANKMRRIIHFTKPDEGPLHDADTYGPDMVRGFSEGIKNNTALTTNATVVMTTDMRNITMQLVKDSLIYGHQVVTNIGLGVQDSTSNLVAIVKTLTDKVTTAFKEGFGIHSPSRVMYEMGNFLMQGLINGMTSKDMNGFIQSWIGGMTGAASGAVSGNLAGWISAAMALTGVSADWFGPLSQIIQHESGGNPMAINLWDSNAAAGHPSKGLMQLIDENMKNHHLPGMDNIYDPISNIAAGIKLIQHDYGTIYNVPGIKALTAGRNYVGYALGTNYATPGYHWVGEHGPELMKLSGGEKVIDHRNSKKVRGDITIEKLADQIIVREEADIDKIANALAKKIDEHAFNM